MNANLRVVRTKAEEDLVANYEGARAELPGSGDVAKLRDAAFDRIRDAGLPHRRVEEYKYSDLRAFLKDASAPAAPASVEEAKGALEHAGTYGDLDRFKLVIANGRLVAELSDLAALEAAGATVSDLADNLAGADAGALLQSPRIAEGDGVVALNTSFLQGGIVLSVDEGTTISKPVEILHLGVGNGARSSRVRIEVGAKAELTVLESLVGSVSAEVNTVSDLDVGDGAKLTLARLIAGEGGAAQLATTFARIGADAHLKTFGFIVGAEFARNQQFVSFTGEHSRADLFGVSMARGRQLADQTLIVDHAVPNCNSREYFKTVLDGEARGVYQGRINVAQHAQKTDGQMMTQALLLSETSEMANKPELEIFADDVLCAHGATSGQIDEDLLFYLRARGIPEKEARTMLILAFLSEAIEEFDEESITETLEDRVRDWLASGD